jgi:hypothetical protein
MVLPSNAPLLQQLAAAEAVQVKLEEAMAATPKPVLKTLNSVLLEAGRLSVDVPAKEKARALLKRANKWTERARLLVPKKRENGAPARSPAARGAGKKKKGAQAEPDVGPTSDLPYLKAFLHEAATLPVATAELEAVEAAVAAGDAFSGKMRELLATVPTLETLQAALAEANELAVVVDELPDINALAAQADTWLKVRTSSTHAAVRAKHSVFPGGGVSCQGGVSTVVACCV